ncbi:MAG: DUF1571 domain-containing protein [Pirellulales bacterium]
MSAIPYLRSVAGVAVWQLLLTGSVVFGEPSGKPDHPLVQVLRMAKPIHEHIVSDIRDYTATLIKRERLGDELSDYITMFIKVRHAQIKDGQTAVPFSVYLRFLGPEGVKGREVMYVEGHNDGKLLAQESPNTVTGKIFGTTALNPTGLLAMRGNRYPITEIGIEMMIRRLMEVAKTDMKYDETKVTILKGAKVGDRTCHCLQVVHPVRRDYFRYHLARVFIDDALNLPIRYASYDWPKSPGDDPPLLEEYTYMDLKINVGLNDSDFDTSHPDYHFK